jgi:hypothetical protein
VAFTELVDVKDVGGFVGERSEEVPMEERELLLLRRFTFFGDNLLLGMSEARDVVDGMEEED